MKLTYSSIWPALIGGDEVFIGVLTREPGSNVEAAKGQPSDRAIPHVFAAGLTSYALELGRCGFGWSTAAAVADYFRWCRPDNGAL